MPINEASIHLQMKRSTLVAQRSLHLAVTNNNLDLVRKILQDKSFSSSQLTKKDAEGNTLLHLAAKCVVNGSRATHRQDMTAIEVNQKICKLLLKNGANIHAVNALGETPLHCASACGGKYVGDNSVIKQLLKKCELQGCSRFISEKNLLGNTALHCALMHMQETTAVGLISHGASMYEVNDQGYSAVELGQKKYTKTNILSGFFNALGDSACPPEAFSDIAFGLSGKIGSRFSFMGHNLISWLISALMIFPIFITFGIALYKEQRLSFGKLAQENMALRMQSAFLDYFKNYYVQLQHSINDISYKIQNIKNRIRIYELECESGGSINGVIKNAENLDKNLESLHSAIRERDNLFIQYAAVNTRYLKISPRDKFSQHPKEHNAKVVSSIENSPGKTGDRLLSGKEKRWAAIASIGKAIGWASASLSILAGFKFTAMFTGTSFLAAMSLGLGPLGLGVSVVSLATLIGISMVVGVVAYKKTKNEIAERHVENIRLNQASDATSSEIESLQQDISYKITQIKEGESKPASRMNQDADIISNNRADLNCQHQPNKVIEVPLFSSSALEINSPVFMRADKERARGSSRRLKLTL